MRQFSQGKGKYYTSKVGGSTVEGLEGTFPRAASLPPPAPSLPQPELATAIVLHLIHTLVEFLVLSS